MSGWMVVTGAARLVTTVLLGVVLLWQWRGWRQVGFDGVLFATIDAAMLAVLVC